ncbi:hypothetical protein GCM10009678_86390 [Actinomadura kijaniata]|uniref:Uncharacterized protein n=1 Tax=Actinomadura namibiensis TaxID=182080 RepID=A0A7W3M0P2_ACTNM|nr:hypothetical protein [Actinomadura namibiensis]MBA8957707.1 hypothetical protein [Actinomadura namibiensis]
MALSSTPPGRSGSSSSSSSWSSSASSAEVSRARAVARLLVGLVVGALLALDDLVTAACGAAPVGPRLRRAAARARWALADRYRAARHPDVVDAQVVDDTELRRWL